MEADGMGCDGSELDGSQANSGLLSHFDLCGFCFDQY